MKYQILSLAVLLTAIGSITEAAPADEVSCEMRLYGNIENSVPQPTTLDKKAVDVTALRAATIATHLNAAAMRRPMMVPNSPYHWTMATLGLQTRLGATGEIIHLLLNYVHAVRLDASGKPEAAVMRAIIGGAALKTNPGEPILYPLPGLLNPHLNPFDPKSGFTPAKIVDGVPVADFHLTQFYELSSGSGVLKVECSSHPSGPVVPPPAPVPAETQGFEF